MSGFTISRRKMLAGSAMLLASTAMPKLALAQTPKKGGRLVLAADSEPRNLNPAIVASNGVFFISSKIVETLAEASFDGKDGLAPRLALSWEGAADGSAGPGAGECARQRRGMQGIEGFRLGHHRPVLDIEALRSYFLPAAASG